MDRFTEMTWISPSPKDAPDTATIVVPRPREADAIGAALTSVFHRSTSLPPDWAATLRALDRLS